MACMMKPLRHVGNESLYSPASHTSILLHAHVLLLQTLSLTTDPKMEKHFRYRYTGVYTRAVLSLSSLLQRCKEPIALRSLKLDLGADCYPRNASLMAALRPEKCPHLTALDLGHVSDGVQTWGLEYVISYLPRLRRLQKLTLSLDWVRVVHKCLLQSHYYAVAVLRVPAVMCTCIQCCAAGRANPLAVENLSHRSAMLPATAAQAAEAHAVTSLGT